MKKIIIGDFVEYNYPFNKLGNYHYANCFARDGYEVLWMSNPFNELVYLKDKDDYRFKRSISRASRHKLADNIYGFAPYSLRLYGNYAFSRSADIVLHNDRYMVPSIKKSLNKIGFDDVDVLWISNPKHYWLSNVVCYKKLVFRIPDDFSHHNSYPSSVARIEEALIEKADLVFVTSRQLEKKVLKNGRVPYILSNGVDCDFFARDYDFPEEYRKNRKRIVYVGAIDWWFDIELVRQISTYIDADVYLIGRSRIDLTTLEGIKNLFILGPRPYSSIPSYMKHANAAIIPFIKNDFTEAISPIKLYEYFSSGIPVVAVYLSEIANAGSPAYLAKNNEDFIFGLNNNLKGTVSPTEFLNFAQKNSWDSRYSDIIKLLNID